VGAAMVIAIVTDVGSLLPPLALPLEEHAATAASSVGASRAQPSVLSFRLRVPTDPTRPDEGSLLRYMLSSLAHFVLLARRATSRAETPLARSSGLNFRLCRKFSLYCGHVDFLLWTLIVHTHTGKVGRTDF
jgi:hypothetical protein